jgi:hypothetical protein
MDISARSLCVPGYAHQGRIARRTAKVKPALRVNLPYVLAEAENHCCSYILRKRLVQAGIHHGIQACGPGTGIAGLLRRMGPD